MDPILVVVICIVVAAVTGGIVWVASTNYHKNSAKSKIGNAEERAREIIDDAVKTAETKKRESLLEIKEESIRAKNELDKEIKERRKEIQRNESRIVQKEENLDKKLEAMEKREANFTAKEEELNKQKAEIAALNEQRIQELERISGLTSEQAKEYLLKTIEDDVKLDTAKLIKELEEQRLNYQLSAKGLLLSLYVEIYRTLMYEKQGGVSQNPVKNIGATLQELESPLSIAPALDYIEENYAQQFTINDLANLCHWSPTHFRRVFHDIMGTSPLDFVNNTRITKACMMLRSSEDSILNISENVGFRSVSSFNRYFIKKMQMSPRDYRKQMQQTDLRVDPQEVIEYSGWMFPE